MKKEKIRQIIIGDVVYTTIQKNDRIKLVKKSKIQDKIKTKSIQS